MKKIIAILGMPGAGKSEAAEFFVRRGYHYLRLGQLTLDEIKKQNLPLTEANERIIREMLRSKHGMAAFAKLNFSKIDENSGNIVIDGLYSWEEYLAFKEKYLNFITLAIFASPATRHARLVSRANRHGVDPNLKFRSFTKDEAKSRDAAEIEKLNKGGPIAMADYTIINEGTAREFTQNLIKIYKQIDG